MLLLEAMLMSTVPAAAGDHVGDWSTLPPETMLVFMIRITSVDHDDVCGLCHHSRSLLPPGTKLMSLLCDMNFSSLEK